METNWPLSKRRSYIWENWGFHCECELCVEDEEAADQRCACTRFIRV
jgi:hypothetical protein